MTGAIAPPKPLNAMDLCDRCGAQAHVRVTQGDGAAVLRASQPAHAEALAKVAVGIQDERTGLVLLEAGSHSLQTR
jgi:hypothetical protein